MDIENVTVLRVDDEVCKSDSYIINLYNHFALTCMLVRAYTNEYCHLDVE